MDHVTSTYTRNIINKIDKTINKYIERYKENSVDELLESYDNPFEELVPEEEIKNDADEILKAIQENFKKYISLEPKEIAQTYDRVMGQYGSWSEIGKLLYNGLDSWSDFALNLENVSKKLEEFDEKYSKKLEAQKANEKHKAKENEREQSEKYEVKKKDNSMPSIEAYAEKMKAIDKDTNYGDDLKKIMKEQLTNMYEDAIKGYYKEYYKSKENEKPKVVELQK